MVINEYECDQPRKWPLVPDVTEECEAVAAISPVDPAEWTPIFEPTSFNLQHKPLEIEKYRLSPEDLKLWAERCVKL